MPKIYVLLVGINNYHPASYPPVPSLQGCVADIEAFRDYLHERINKDEYELVEPQDTTKWILLNQDATRQAIIDGFQDHLCKAGSEDVALFYYAGHGAQEKASEEFWHLEPDHLNETLVCYDSRTEGSWDLADKELSYLIARVAERQPRIVMILDCCHSGSGTREGALVTDVRTAPLDIRERSLLDFIFAEDKVVVEHLFTSNEAGKKTASLVLPKGKHILVAACRDHQEAKEYLAEDGQQRGTFSYFLLQALQRTNGNISYRDLAWNINALVSGKVRDQSPQIEATDSEDLKNSFLGDGAIKDRPSYFVLTRGKDRRWVINGGAVHGIPKVSAGTEALLAVFPAGNEERLRQLSEPLAEAKITEVLPNQSVVQIINSKEPLSDQASYWAVFTSLPLKPLNIYIKSDDENARGIELATQALQKAKGGQLPSLYLNQVMQPEAADYHLLAQRGQYWITPPLDDRAMVAPVPLQPAPDGRYTYQAASEVIRYLEAIARWLNILELSSPSNSSVKPTDLQLEINILRGNKASSPNPENTALMTSDMRLEYVYENNKDEWLFPGIQLTITNQSNKTLYCNVLLLSEDYKVALPFFDERSSVRILPQGQITSKKMGLAIPPDYLEQGFTEYKDILKLIVSTTDFDASLSEQEGLAAPITRGLKRPRGLLNRLMDQVYTRNPVPFDDESNDDWMTKEIAITVVRPQDAKAIQSNQDVVLWEGVAKILPHPTLQAKTSLTTVPQVRSLNRLTLPAILQSDASISQPFQFTASRGSDPGFSALELSEVENSDAVTPESPLKLLVNTSLGEGEHLLPIAYDGEFFLPLGRAIRTPDNQIEITLERLPRPTVDRRSLQGAIRILFQKVISQKLGKPYDKYPSLATVEVEQDVHKGGWKVIYERDLEKVKAHVAQAQRILLYIHGIIGDTESMVPSIQTAKVQVDGQERSLRDIYDLVLAFDYDSLNTDIPATAKRLEQQLERVGLGANHGKKLHFVAHSMGGLISRWFIEQGEGRQVVQHLVMLGTPNAGSPWPVVQDWAFTALSLGLNQLSAVVWPAKVIASLLDFLDREGTKALDQMQPGSEILTELAVSRDPGVQYTIVVGDRSLTPSALQPQTDKGSPVQRLVKTLFGKAVNKAVNLTFFGEPNDIAVLLTSIKNVSAERSPKPIILIPNAACDHLTYFTNLEGLKKLSQALFPNQS